MTDSEGIRLSRADRRLLFRTALKWVEVGLMKASKIEEVIALNLSRDRLLVSLAAAGDKQATREVLRRMEIRAEVLGLDRERGPYSAVSDQR